MPRARTVLPIVPQPRGFFNSQHTRAHIRLPFCGSAPRPSIALDQPPKAHHIQAHDRPFTYPELLDRGAYRPR